jgi:hypothetical protein
MPAMSWCELKVTGLLGDSLAVNAAEVVAFKAVFPANCPQPPSPPGPGSSYPTTTPWPDGLILPNYKPMIWIASAEELPVGMISQSLGVPYQFLTQLTFHAQLYGTFPGSLYKNKAAMLKEVEWFYHYCDYQWLKDLKTKIKGLNDSYKKTPRVINTVDVREWKWYCGNGAGD